jgi:DNA-binding NarL/FixJ family response regulator
VIRILLADDQDVVREGLRAIFDTTADLRVVAEAADGAEAVRLAERDKPAVVVMDIRMPVLDGIAATERILASGPTAPRVLVLTVFGEEQYVYEALRAGASGFMLKDATRDELAEAVRLVARGDQVLSPRITRSVVEQYVRRRPASTGTPPDLQALSAREIEIMMLVAHGLSNADIAERLYLGLGTVKTHVAHILSKLALRDRVQVVVLAYECGLLEPGAAEPTLLDGHDRPR